MWSSRNGISRSRKPHGGKLALVRLGLVAEIASQASTSPSRRWRHLSLLQPPRDHGSALDHPTRSHLIPDFDSDLPPSGPQMVRGTVRAALDLCFLSGPRTDALKVRSESLPGLGNCGLGMSALGRKPTLMPAQNADVLPPRPRPTMTGFASGDGEEFQGSRSLQRMGADRRLTDFRSNRGTSKRAGQSFPSSRAKIELRARRSSRQGEMVGSVRVQNSPAV